MGLKSITKKCIFTGRHVVLILFSVHFLLTGVASADCQPFDDETRTTYRELICADFCGPPSVTNRAYVSTSIHVTWTKVVVQPESGEWVAKLEGVCVQAIMHKDLSGFRRGTCRESELPHEQIHFDIVHYYALYIGSKLDHLKYGAASHSEAERGLLAQVKLLHKSVVSSWRNMEAKFDRGGTTTRDAMHELQWGRKIDAMLATIPRD